MTQATDLTFAARRTSDMRLVAGVSTAHFVSHFYMLVLPPLFVFVKDDYGVSYTEVGLAITVFNLVSAVAQTPAGFLIDRINARFALIVGLLLGAAGFTVAGLVNSYWMLVAMFGVIGLGNTVYHPADYALLSRYVAPERISQPIPCTPSRGCSAVPQLPPRCWCCTGCSAGAVHFSARRCSA